MTTPIPYRIYQHSPLVNSLLILRRNTLVHGTTKKECNGVFMFE